MKKECVGGHKKLTMIIGHDINVLQTMILKMERAVTEFDIKMNKGGN